MSDKQIKSLLQKDISRNINPVVLVHQSDKDILGQELEEYVIVPEIEGIFRDFFNAYEPKTTEDIGVWISGFFGSGKSHFLKILSHILENQDFEGKKAFDYIKSKFSDKLLASRIEAIIRKSKTHTILFDIDTIANVDSKQNKNGIAEIMQKALDQYEGYFAETPWLAEFERKLFHQGNYQQFQDAYKAITKKIWTEDRKHYAFSKKQIIKALQRTTDNDSEKDAQWLLDKASKDYTLSVEQLVQNIRAYLGRMEIGTRLAFLVDEVGQYVGESKQLMLNLQTVAEEFRKQLKGKAWIMVTSQEAIDEIAKDFRGADFSRIKARFSTALSLTGSSADTIVKKRLLEKTKEASEYLNQLYTPIESQILNKLDLQQTTSEYKSYKDCQDFIATYPFVSYQFHLIQELFKQIRIVGIAGAHTADTERNMIKAVHEVGKLIKDEKIGTLAITHQFFDTFKHDIRHDARQTIDRAQDIRDFDPFDVSVLKTLFMIKYVKDIKGSLDNIVTLMVSGIDEDKVLLTDKVKESLQKLENENLIQHSVDQYEYLTNTEQEVIARIKNIEIKSYEKVSQIRKIIQEQIYTDKKFSQNKNNYGYNIIVDEGDPNLREEISLRVITFYNDDYRDNTSQMALKYTTNTEVVIIFPNKPELNESLERQLQIDKYLTQETTTSVSEEIKTVHINKRDELSKLKQKNIELIETVITEADFYHNGDKQTIAGNSAKEKIHKALNVLVEGAYQKAYYLKIPARDINEIINILKVEQTTIDSGNQQASEELIEYINSNNNRNNPINVHDVIQRFSKIPYGWDEMGILGLIAASMFSNIIDLELNHERLDPKNSKDTAQKLINNRNASSIVIKIKKQIQSDKISQLQNIIRKIFDNPAELPDNQDDLKLKIFDLVNHDIEKISQFNDNYRDYAYPGKDLLASYRRQITGIIDKREVDTLFDYIITNQKDIQKAKEEAKNAITFFDNQKDIFNSAVDLLHALEDDKPFLPEDIQTTLQQIKDILINPDPYEQVKDLTLIKSDVTKAHQELLNEEKKVLLQKIDKVKKEIYSLVSSQKIKRIDDLIEKKLSELKDHINHRTNIAAVKAAEQQIAQIEEELIKLINQPLGDDSQKPTKPIQFVSIHSLVKKSSISSAEELDKYIEQLKQKLLDILNQGNRIKLGNK
ncbi:BREX system P-loop protein BrxC [Patescibacteria group bacterium]